MPALWLQQDCVTRLAWRRDALGNLYIADRENNRVRRVDLVGTITTVAGTGTRGYSGDGGPATAAQLSRPSGLAVDALGNLYIADSGNHRIRQVALAGRMTGGPPPSERRDDHGNDASGATRPGLNSSLDGVVETVLAYGLTNDDEQLRGSPGETAIRRPHWRLTG